MVVVMVVVIIFPTKKMSHYQCLYTEQSNTTMNRKTSFARVYFIFYYSESAIFSRERDRASPETHHPALLLLLAPKHPPLLSVLALSLVTWITTGDEKKRQTNRILCYCNCKKCLTNQATKQSRPTLSAIAKTTNQATKQSRLTLSATAKTNRKNQIRRRERLRSGSNDRIRFWHATLENTATKSNFRSSSWMAKGFLTFTSKLE